MRERQGKAVEIFGSGQKLEQKRGEGRKRDRGCEEQRQRACFIMIIPTEQQHMASSR